MFNLFLKTLLSKLFSWEGMEINNESNFQFYNVELKVHIGEFASGTKCDCIFFQGDINRIVLVINNKFHTFDFNINVGEKIATEPVDTSTVEYIKYKCETVSECEDIPECHLIQMYLHIPITQQ